MTQRLLGWSLVVLAFFYGAPVAHADLSNSSSTNVQEGDNESESDQSGSSESGDAVAGQVIGVQSSGDASVDATNTTRDSSATSGDVEGSNVRAAFVGQDAGGVDVGAADVANGSAGNVQDGDNAADSAQSAEAVSGDAVAGQVAGVTTAPGGTADLVLSNLTEDVDAESGDAEFDNLTAVLVGLFAGPGGGDGASSLVLNISDAVSPEPGTLSFVVSLTPVRRSKDAAKTGAAQAMDGGQVTFHAQTSDGSANSETDYEPIDDTFTFGAQPDKTKTTMTINSSTFVDGQCEQDENMFITITSASGASIGDGVGEGTILFSEEC